MPGLKVKVTGTKFLQELQARRNSFSGRAVSGVLVVPPELKWWVWLEFGTMPHAIDPGHPPEALRWFDAAGGAVIRDHVNNPGIRPRAFVRKAMPTITSVAKAAVYNAFIQNGFRYTAVRVAMRDAMNDAKAVIVQSLSQETKTSARNDKDARIPGRTAAQEFASKSTIEIRET
jgi:hypothetical protein